MGDRKKEPYGPTESDNAVHLIGQQILYALEKEGLGNYGVLESIQFGQEYPYLVVNDNGLGVRTNWIVKY
jgi:hypothetical protein